MNSASGRGSLLDFRRIRIIVYTVPVQNIGRTEK